MSKKTIRTVSLGDLAAMEDRTRSDAPDGPSLGPDFWKTAKIVLRSFVEAHRD